MEGHITFSVVRVYLAECPIRLRGLFQSSKFKRVLNLYMWAFSFKLCRFQVLFLKLLLLAVES